MRHSAFTVVYDACVLYPAPLRDLLIRLGLSGRFRARWSALIHDEWKRNLLANRADLKPEQLDRTSALMDKAISDAVVTGFEPLIQGLSLPDPDDRHVLAAAIACKASVIVTFNRKDFPDEVLAEFGIEAQHPDDFIEYLFDLDQAVVVTAVKNQRETLQNPAVGIDQFWTPCKNKGYLRR